ncbi:hypothetical protein C8J56DRAFT_1068904 [Mycena floridula]|nr:hypothetical protein C8J56DRAFT_1068904 [Mycena floridula]
MACLNNWKAMGPKHIYLYGQPDSPWTLSQVCQSWCQTCWSLPCIWSLINVDRILPEEKQLMILLERSASTPLDISITDPHPFMSLQNGRLMNLLIPSAPRWKSLHLSIANIGALRAIHGHLDNLKELSITFASTGDYVESFTMFELAPALQSVEISYPVLQDGDLAELHLPWSTITHYTTDSLSGDRRLVVQLQLLALCINLVEANLHEVTKFAVERITEGAILPSLAALSVSTLEAGDLALLFSKLNLPALSDLYLDCCEIWSDSDQNSIRSLVARSKCTLRSVEFRAPVFDIEDSLFNCFTESPSITDVTVSAAASAVLDLLHCIDNSESPLILPNLTSVTFAWQTDSDADFILDDILDMAESRVSALGCTTFAKVQISDFLCHGRCVESSVMARVNQLRKAGLVFIFTE